MVLQPDQVKAIKQWAAQGRSGRWISRRTGHSRTTISKILRGDYPDYEAIRQEKEDMAWLFSGPPERCPECGAMVYMPCIACRDRRSLQIRRVVRAAESAADRRQRCDDPRENGFAK